MLNSDLASKIFYSSNGVLQSMGSQRVRHDWATERQILLMRLSLLLLLSHFSHVRLCDPIDGSPPGSPCSWDSPGKNTGVGCHFLLQCMKVKSETEDAQSCPTLSDPMDCSLPGSSVHRIFQAVSRSCIFCESLWYIKFNYYIIHSFKC